jgi:glycosyltransferase involved in cell wall biosynthesis
MDISVIMPVYNGAKYVKKAVESVLKQQGVEFELWLVDDGSTDESPKICDAYVKADSRVHVIHKKNEGPGIARNTAIEQATGEFVFFLDCDDWLVDHALDYLYHLAQAKNADIVCYGIHKTRDREACYEFQDVERVSMYEGEEVLRRYFTKMTATICKLFRRHIFDHYRFEAVQLCEDAWSMHLFFSEAKIMLVTDTICYVQYLHDDSRSRKEFSSQKFISEICGKRMVEFAGES